MKKLLLFVFSFMFLFGFAQTELKSKAQDFNTIKNKGGKLNEITKSSQFSEASHNQLQRNQNVIASHDASDQNEVLPKVSRIYYVKTNGTGSGISWNDAANLSDLLVNLASNPNPDWSTSSPVQIWVAKGYYVPTFTYGGGNTRDRTYLLVRNVQLFGGFNGDETTLDARRPMQNETILNGEKTIAHVLVSAGDVGVALVDGFTIWNGNADYSGDITLNGEGINHRYGGGIYI